ncbi:MAG: hypothetical protein WD278_20700, partial [Pirellulales bacterium]
RRDAARSRAWRRPEQAGRRDGSPRERSDRGRPAAHRHPLDGQVLRPDPRGADVRHRLAQIDRMRDEALVTGNSQLLDRADRLEAEVHAGGQFTPGYGQLTAAQARGEEVVLPPDGVYGPGYGLLTAEEARTLGRDFGQRTAEAARARQEAEFEDGTSSAEMESEFGSGYGRFAARRRLPRDEERAEAMESADGQFQPGYGRLTAAQARGEEVVLPPDGVYGPGYGRLTAEEARSLGRDFGQRTAEAARATFDDRPLFDPDSESIVE